MSRVVLVAEGICLSELKKKLATGIMMSPVFLTNDRAIGYLFKHMKVKSSMNLFVKFEKIIKRTDSSVFDEAEARFVTPGQTKQKHSGTEEADSFRHGYASTAGSKTHETLFDDVDLVRQVEMIEEKIVGGSGKSKVSEWSDDTGEPGSKFCGAEDFDESDVRPRGYDKEF